MNTKNIDIRARELFKSFDRVKAVDGVDFDVYAGEVFGFLGPNGAGKTTTINMLTGLARPDAGSIRIAGIDCTRKPRSAQHLMGIVPDESNLYPELSGRDNLLFCAALYGMDRKSRRSRTEQLLEEFGLTQAGERKFAGYSKGMKRKLTIAAGIIHNPKILFLDEPTTGIDVASARQLRRMISDLNHSGTTIFLTTHFIEEAERLCSRIAFIVSGRIIRTDSVDNLLKPLQGRHVLQIACAGQIEGILEELARSFPDNKFSSPGRNLIKVESSRPVRVGPLIRFLEDHETEVLEARRIRLSLEEVFVDITGIETRAMAKGSNKQGSNQ